jgi:hypothetical protein
MTTKLSKCCAAPIKDCCEPCSNRYCSRCIELCDVEDSTPVSCDKVSCNGECDTVKMCLCLPQPCTKDHQAEINKEWKRKCAEAEIRLDERQRAKAAVTPVVRHETITECIKLIESFQNERLPVEGGESVPCWSPVTLSYVIGRLEKLKSNNPQ